MSITHLFTLVIYNPILNLLIFLYNVVPGHDIGVAIILITLLIRLLLAPFMHKSLKGQKAMSALQPKLNELREKHKDNKEAQAKAMMDLYKDNKVNPLGSCLPLLIQLPILIALYQVLRHALSGHLGGLYHFVHNPGFVDPRFLHFIDLSKPNYIFAILAGLTQYWQSKLMVPQGATDATAKAMNVQMTYILPLVSIFIAWSLPAGLPLYWIVMTLFAVGQQIYINRTHKAAS